MAVWHRNEIATALTRLAMTGATGCVIATTVRQAQDERVGVVTRLYGFSESGRARYPNPVLNGSLFVWRLSRSP